MAPILSRQRDLFPLPSFNYMSVSKYSGLSRGVQRRINNRESWAPWSNICVRTLNDMVGRGQHVVGAATLAQKMCLENVERSFRPFSAGPPVGEVPRGDASLREMLSTAMCYDAESSPVQPYDRDLVSWPEEGATPAPLTQLLSDADSKSFEEWESNLLRPIAETEALFSDLGN
jgi:hypothetical protein